MGTYASVADLPYHRVDVVEPGSNARRHCIRCEIGKNLQFDTTKLETYCLANWDARVYDAFVLAAAIQFCDHTKKRPSTAWGRNIELRMPVHDPEHWHSALVSKTLHNALELLTGDRWKITFTSRKSPALAPHQSRFNIPDESCVIIPFSDGLDSCAAVGLAKQEHGNKLIPVRLGPKSLNGNTIGSKPRPFALVPYSVRYQKRGSVEPSSRTRGFKFALLSGIAAYLSQTKQIIVPESGQGILGPTLVPVGQAYKDYRNHPRFTNLMEAFILAIFSHKVRYTYPYLWQTKGETLRAFVDNCNETANWEQTRSCWRGQRQTSVSKKMRQCGICAACMLRRMSVHAAGLSESKETYVWENLNAARFEEGSASAFGATEPRGANFEYAIAGTLHLDHLADLLNSSVYRIGLDLEVFQLSRALGQQEEDIKRNLKRLLTKHKEEWDSFVASLGERSFIVQWILGAQ